MQLHETMAMPPRRRPAQRLDATARGGRAAFGKKTSERTVIILDKNANEHGDTVPHTRDTQPSQETKLATTIPGEPLLEALGEQRERDLRYTLEQNEGSRHDTIIKEPPSLTSDPTHKLDASQYDRIQDATALTTQENPFAHNRLQETWEKAFEKATTPPKQIIKDTNETIPLKKRLGTMTEFSPQLIGKAILEAFYRENNRGATAANLHALLQQLPDVYAETRKKLERALTILDENKKVRRELNDTLVTAKQQTFLTNEQAQRINNILSDPRTSSWEETRSIEQVLEEARQDGPEMQNMIAILLEAHKHKFDLELMDSALRNLKQNPELNESGVRKLRGILTTTFSRESSSSQSRKGPALKNQSVLRAKLDQLEQEAAPESRSLLEALNREIDRLEELLDVINDGLAELALSDEGTVYQPFFEPVLRKLRPAVMDHVDLSLPQVIDEVKTGLSENEPAELGYILWKLKKHAEAHPVSERRTVSGIRQRTNKETSGPISFDIDNPFEEDVAA